MVASPHVWSTSRTSLRPAQRHEPNCGPYLPYPRFLRDLHNLQDLALVALPHRLRALAQHLLDVHHICVLVPEPGTQGQRWRDSVEGRVLDVDAQGSALLPCGFAVPTSWLVKAYRARVLHGRRVGANRHLLALAVRGGGEAIGLLIVSREGQIDLTPAVREALPHLCRGVGIAWENKLLREALAAKRPPLPEDIHLQSPASCARALWMQRERRLRRRAIEAESIAQFLSKTSTLLGTSLDYTTTLKQALRLAIPFLGTAAQLDMLLPNHRIARWRGGLSRDARMETCLARVVEMDDTDPRFARQRVALGTVGATFIVRSYGRQQVMVPLYSRGKILGVLSVVRAMRMSSRRRPNRNMGNLVECFGRRVAAALDNAQLHAQLGRAVRVRNEFLAMASHELRTPVMAMSLKLEHLLRSLRAGQVSQLSERALKQHMALKLDGALQCADRLSQLVANLVDVSHLRTDHMTLTRGHCSLSECVRQVVQLHQPQFLRRGCALVSHIEEHVCGYWDRQRIGQLVEHLLGNAVKYGAGRPIKLTVVRCKDVAILRVTDQGIGITADSVQRIFGRFERATSIRSYGGFGLGLYITREIISAHGGVLHVKSSPEQGATFEVHLPLSGASAAHGPPAAPHN